MKKFTIWTFLLMLFPAVVIAATESVVLIGVPITQSKGNIQSSENFKLTESQQNEYRLLITKAGEDYFWKTRENKQLIKGQSGEITIFIEPGGAGYVRISKVDGKVLYMEHMTHGFQTITYWGIAEDFAP